MKQRVCKHKFMAKIYFKHFLNKLFNELYPLNEINCYLCRVFMNFILLN